MSLANDPRRIPDDEIPVYDCRFCDRETHDGSRICPDCYHEGQR